MVIETHSYEETFEFGRKLGIKSTAGTVYCLDGDLGTGKTVMAKGIAKGLGIDEPVSSPTFTLLKEYYEGRLPFYHFDVYRIEDPSSMEEIGYEEYFYGDGVTVIEWSEMIEELLPESAIRIRISKDPEKGFDYRRIDCDGA